MHTVQLCFVNKVTHQNYAREAIITVFVIPRYTFLHLFTIEYTGNGLEYIAKGVFYRWIHGAEIGYFSTIFCDVTFKRRTPPYIWVHFLSRLGLISGLSKICEKRVEIRQ